LDKTSHSQWNCVDYFFLNDASTCHAEYVEASGGQFGGIAAITVIKTVTPEG